MAIYPSDSVICFYTTGLRTIITRKWSSFSSKQSIGSKLASDSQLERGLLSSRITMRANSAMNCPYQSPLKLSSKANVFIENTLSGRLAEEQNTLSVCGIYKISEFKLLLQRPVEKRNLFPCKIFANSSMR